MVAVECSGILFDLDGTLIDSGTAVQDAWTQFAVSLGRDPAEILRMCHGKRTVEVIELLGLDTPVAETADAVESLIINAGSRPIAGAVEFLMTLPPDCWAVVTSSMTKTAWSRFDLTELPSPAAIVSADDVAVGKPDPQCYLQGAQLLALSPSDCLVFEDAVAGIGAGLAAGMEVVALLGTEDRADLVAATHVVADFTAVRLVDVRRHVTGRRMLTLELDE